MTNITYDVKEYDLFIGGEWLPAEKGQTFERHSPINGERVGIYARATEADALNAVKAARQAFDEGPWPHMDTQKRADVLLKTADILMQRQDELAMRECLETGSPLRTARNFIQSAANTFRYFAGLVRTVKGDTFSFSDQQMGFTVKEPVGVASLILPWNFPLGEATWKVCPALAAGCTVIVKADVKTPSTALELGPILKEAGLPDGAYNALVGNPADMGDVLTAHPDIDHISFTGSTRTGRVIMQNASPTVKPLHLELGGKSPLIVFEDADVDAAASDAAFGIFWHCGQVCTASSRLLVQESVKDAFVERLSHYADEMKIGDPFEDDTVLGPVISHEHMDTIMGYIQRGIDEGATLLKGGVRLAEPPFDQGAYLPPTIFTGADNNMTIAQEEIFGPVAAVLSFRDAKEALAIANHSKYGLGAGVWTNSLNTAWQMARGLKSGSVWINGYGSERLEMPWGGYKQSGYGRELGEEGLDEYLQTKSIHMKLTDLE